MAVNNVTPLEISGSAPVTAVSLAAIATKVLSANSERKGGAFFNNATSIVYLSFANTVSASLFTTRLTGFSYFEIPERYTGDVWAIRPTGGANDLLITEYS